MIREKFYARKDCIKDAMLEDFTGKVVVLYPECFKEEFRKPQYQLWYATSGFGCQIGKIGGGVFAMCLEDGESAKWRRSDVMGVLKDEEIEKLDEKYLEKIKKSE